eukprot:NODE_41_length_34096_cov_2.002235.p10 type:complete len:339 gc:universal NODE_41_length_34096_cov_2.002235:3187-4203(+)
MKSSKIKPVKQTGKNLEKVIGNQLEVTSQAELEAQNGQLLILATNFQQEIDNLKQKLLEKEAEKQIMEEKSLNDIRALHQKITLIQYENNLKLLENKTENDKIVEQKTISGIDKIQALEKLIGELQTQITKSKSDFQLALHRQMQASEEQRQTYTRQHLLDVEQCKLQLNNKVKAAYAASELEVKAKVQHCEDYFQNHIKQLIENHERAILNLKSYFNEVIQNQVSLLDSLKEQLSDSKLLEEKYKRQLNLVAKENKCLKVPLEEFKLENDFLKKEIVTKNRHLHALKLEYKKQQIIKREKDVLEQENLKFKSQVMRVKDDWEDLKVDYNHKMYNLFK